MLEIGFEMEFSIFDCEVDTMNNICHGNYLKYLELARYKLFESIGCSYETIASHDIVCPVIKINMSFLGAIKLNQKIKIRCFLQEIEPGILVDYEIYDKESKKLLFTGCSVQTYVDVKSKKSFDKAPEFLQKATENIVND